MKFIHLSDICIGNSVESGTPWAEDRETELTDSLRNVLSRAEDDGVKLLIISGGLFAFVPSESELSIVRDIFRSHPGIEIVITAGKRDRITGSSPVKSFEWSDNVHYVLSERPERIVLNKLNVEIFAASAIREINLEQSIRDIKEEMPILPFKDIFEINKSGETIIKETDRDADPKELIISAEGFDDREPVRIAVLCSDNAEELKRAFRGSGFSYVAVGGNVKERELIKDLMYCPGALEPYKREDAGEHGALEGSISEETGVLQKIDFIPLASISYVTLNVRLTPQTTASELNKSITSELKRRGEKNIYRLRLTGSRDPQENLGLSEIKNVFRISEIIDESEPKYDLNELFKEHSQDMIGFYISSIMSSKKEMSQTERKAMFYGIEALLNSAAETGSEK